MKYLCLVYHEESKRSAMSRSEAEAIFDALLEYRTSSVRAVTTSPPLHRRPNKQPRPFASGMDPCRSPTDPPPAPESN